MRAGIPILFLACLLGILLYPALLAGNALVPADGIFLFPPWGQAPREAVSNYLLVDQYLYLHPFARFLHERFLEGRLPLWNPLINCGVPFLASMQTAALFPINLLLLPLDPYSSAGWGAFLKLSLAGGFMILYLRGMGAGAAAAAFSGIVFSMSGYMIVWLGHPHVNCAMWLPLLFWLIDEGLDQPRRWGLFAMVYACMILGGHPPTVLHVSMACAAYFFWRAPEGFRYRNAPLFLSAVAVGVLLAAPQILPFLEYVSEGSVGAASEGLARWKTHRSAWTLLHYLQPYLTGSPALGHENLREVFGFGGHENFNERTNFVGVLTLFFAAAAIRFRRDRAVLFHASLAGIGLAGVLGIPPVAAVFRFVPFLNQTSPGRLSLWIGFSLAVLGGLGFDRVLCRDRPKGLPVFACVGGAVGAVILIFSYWAVGCSESARRSGSGLFVLGQALWAGGGVLMVLLLATKLADRKLPWTRYLCLGWISLEMLSFARGYNPAVPRSVYYPKTDTVRFLDRDKSLFRLAGVGGALPANTGMIFGLSDIRGQDFMSVGRYEELITMGAGDFHFYASARNLPPTLSSLNVKYVVTPPGAPPPRPGLARVFSGETDIYRVEPFSERALIVYDYEVLPDKRSVLARMAHPGFVPAETLIVEEPPPPLPILGAGTPGQHRVKIIGYEPDEVVVEADLFRPGYLLLLDTYYPGWNATVDGAAAPIFRADYNFRAVPLPRGRSVVRFRYEPGSFSAGVLLSFCAFALIATVGVRR